MNIVPHSPNIQYGSINQATDVLRQQNQVKEAIPQATEVKAYPPERPISDADRLRNMQTAAEPNPQEAQQAGEQQTTINEREQGQDRQQNQEGEAQQNARNGDQNEGDSNEPSFEDLQRQQVIDELVARDKEVRAHEQAHDSVGGPYTGTPGYSYERGPDGVNYATSGHVSVDLSSIPGDPKATISKMQRIRQAALAPANPSPQDQQVAATAQRIIAQQQITLLDTDGKISPPGNPPQSASNQRFDDVEEAIFGSGSQNINTVSLRALRINNFYQQTSEPIRTPLTIQV